MTTPTADHLDFSVVVPVFNNADDLKKCLDCLSRQSLGQDRFEVIVVDNGSQQPPEALVSEYPFARFAQEAKPGSYAARNTGVGMARGEYLAFTDSDCLPDERWLEGGLAALAGPDKVDVVAGRIEVEAQDPTAPNLAELYDIANRFDQKTRVAKENGVVTANMMTSRETFDAVGPFDDSLMSGADALWSMRAADMGYAVRYVEGAMVVHPGRTTIKLIRIQARRFAQGRFDMMTRNTNRSPLYWLRLAAKKILPRLDGALSMRQRLRRRGFGVWAWLKVLLVVQLVHYTGTFSQIARLWGGKSERR